jgi:hypothetical protein
VCSAGCSLCLECAANLTVSGATTTPGGETCVLVQLSNPSAVRGAQGVVLDLPDELTPVSAECTGRTSGFSCSVNEVPGTGEIQFVVIDLGGRCIAPGGGPIARICLNDQAPVCSVDSLVDLAVSDVVVADCVQGELAPICTEGGSVLCESEAQLGDCLGDGDFDLADILFKIQIILQRAMPTAAQRVLCDDNCDLDIDILDVVREIDALLERIPLPLTCPEGAQAAALEAPRGERSAETAVIAERATKRAPRKAAARLRGRSIVLQNPDAPVRALELTFVPEGGPAKLREVRSTRRLRNLEVAMYQSDPGAPAKVVVYALDGAAIPSGRGTVARLVTERVRGGGRLKLREVKIVEESAGAR